MPLVYVLYTYNSQSRLVADTDKKPFTFTNRHVHYASKGGKQKEHVRFLLVVREQLRHTNNEPKGVSGLHTERKRLKLNTHRCKGGNSAASRQLIVSRTI